MTGLFPSAWMIGCAIELPLRVLEYSSTAEYPGPGLRAPGRRGKPHDPDDSERTEYQSRRVPIERSACIPWSFARVPVPGYSSTRYSQLPCQFSARIPAAQLFLAGRSNPSRSEPRSVRLVSNTTLFSRMAPDSRSDFSSWRSTDCTSPVLSR